MNIHEAKNLLMDDLKLLAEMFEDSDKYFESIEYILVSLKEVFEVDSMTQV